MSFIIPYVFVGSDSCSLTCQFWNQLLFIWKQLSKSTKPEHIAIIATIKSDPAERSTFEQVVPQVLLRHRSQMRAQAQAPAQAPAQIQPQALDQSAGHSQVRAPAQLSRTADTQRPQNEQQYRQMLVSSVLNLARVYYMSFATKRFPELQVCKLMLCTCLP